MVDKVEAGKLVLEIGERVRALRELVRDSGVEVGSRDYVFAHDVIVIGTATKRLADYCDVEIP